MNVSNAKRLAVLIYVIIPILLFSQSQIVKGLGSNQAEDRGWSIIATYDGGYAIAGQTFGYGAGNGDAFVVKFDANCSVEWAKTIGTTDGTELAKSLCQAEDSSYLITGFTAIYPQFDLFITRLSKKGDALWTKKISGDPGGSSIIQTTDLGFAVASGSLAKFDMSGTLQWSSQYGGTALVQASDGGYVVVGATYAYGAGQSDARIIKLDSTGAPVWARAFGGSDYDWATDVTRTSDNGYLVVGWTRSFAPVLGTDNYLIAKFDSAGTVLWAKTLGESYGASDENASSVYATIDSGFVVVGTTEGMYGPGHVLLTKFDSQENYEWGYVIDATTGLSVAQAMNGGYAVTGYAENYGYSNFFIAKYESTGTTCLGIPASPQPLIIPAACSVTIYSPDTIPGSPDTTTPSFAVSDVVFDEILLCMNDITPPVIESTTVWSDTAYNGPFEIGTKVTDTISGIDSVRLLYKRDEDADWVMSRMHANGHWYYDTIPEVGNNDDTVRYYIWANDYGEPANIATDPDEAPDAFYWFIGGATAVAEYQKTPSQFRFCVASPARHHAVFRLSLPMQCHVSLRIYNVLGRLVSVPLSGSYAPGYYGSRFEPGTNGVYFYELKSSTLNIVKKGKIIILL